MKIEKLRDIALVLKDARMIYIAGNGGSASLADHFACDLLKNCGLPAVSLCSNQALITAIANDYDYKEIFLRQLRILLKEGDIFIALSTRGESSNIVEAAKYCHSRYNIVVGVAGFDGGELRRWSSIFCYINSCNMRVCEDKMNELCHKISDLLQLCDNLKDD